LIKIQEGNRPLCIEIFKLRHYEQIFELTLGHRVI
jgi:hypothetical protein